MSEFFGFVACFAFLALVIGLIKPSLVVRWGDADSRNRKKVFKTYFVLTVIAIAALGVTAPSNNTNKNEPKTVAESTSSSKEVSKKPAEDKEETWNKSEPSAEKNGNLKIAVRELKKIDNIKGVAETQPGGIVIKRPWDYYGKILSYTGTVSDISDYAPDSKEAKAMGGKAFAIVIKTEDGTVVQGEIEGDSGTIKKGEQATICGYPVGTVEGPNKMGGKSTYLLIVGKQ